MKSYKNFGIILQEMYANKNFIKIKKNHAWSGAFSPHPTGKKHTISTFVYQTHIQRTRPCRKTVFFKTSLPGFFNGRAGMLTNIFFYLALLGISAYQNYLIASKLFSFQIRTSKHTASTCQIDEVSADPPYAVSVVLT